MKQCCKPHHVLCKLLSLLTMEECVAMKHQTFLCSAMGLEQDMLSTLDLTLLLTPLTLTRLSCQVWKTRRRAIVPALHRRYIASMVAMFGDCMAHGARVRGLTLHHTPVVSEDSLLHISSATLSQYPSSPGHPSIFCVPSAWGACARPNSDTNHADVFCLRRWRTRHGRGGQWRWRTSSAA